MTTTGVLRRHTHIKRLTAMQATDFCRMRAYTEDVSAVSMRVREDIKSQI